MLKTAHVNRKKITISLIPVPQFVSKYHKIRDLILENIQYPFFCAIDRFVQKRSRKKWKKLVLQADCVKWEDNSSCKLIV